MAQAILAPFHQQRPKFLLRGGDCAGFQWHPFDFLAPGVVLDGDPDQELAIASP